MADYIRTHPYLICGGLLLLRLDEQGLTIGALKFPVYSTKDGADLSSSAGNLISALIAMQVQETVLHHA